MPFKIGDIVWLNPKYYATVDITKGIILVETAEWDAKLNIIQWEDNRIGYINLATNSDYVILV